LIPSVYFDFLRSGDARPLKNVFYHNAMDILAMAALLTHMADLIDDPLNGTLNHALDWSALGKLYEHLGYLDMAGALYQRGLEEDLPEANYWETLQRLSFVYRRQGNLEAAVEVWRQAAEGRQIYAFVELAKFYEHTARDVAEAARWTEAALTLVELPRCSRSERRRWQPDLEHRLARLQRKLQK
jgi:tetratricopeptide (TPR) repeat protein